MKRTALTLVVAAVAAIAAPSSARAQFPERRAELEAQPIVDEPVPAAPSDTQPRPAPETVEETVKRLLRMLFPADLRIGLHGYFRAPLRLSIDHRASTMPGESA
ncbi:MAG: hypothetical protein ACXVAN_10615, partial [Polyangia bacterium]